MHGIALKYIDAVNRHGSIREAARRLNVSSSSITRQLQKVEYHFGIRIFERGTDGVRTTDTGRILLAHIGSTLRDWERTQIQLEATIGKRTKVIDIAATDSIASSFLPNLLSDCLEENTAVRFRTLLKQSPQVCEAVFQGEADVGFTFLSKDDPGVATKVEHQLQVGILASQEHPLAIRDSVSLGEALEYPMVASSVRAPVYQEIGKQLGERYENYEPWIKTDSITMIHALVDSGRFISLGTVLYTIKNRSGAKELFRIPISDSTLPDDRLVLVTRKENPTDTLDWFVRKSTDFLDRSFGGNS
ncbi:LysR family transcriptional regulator [Ruegeria lacuscaerulensis]|uniref:LysR family transcriptional regulator n=1 Tax=Ruegeria lacuscaerulensis TaxID=55218 RepID=UPI00147C1A2D|nr:LysR family transcriptional regulator [Ruegeria lacuscaerulensis]